MPNGKDMIIHLIVGLIKRMLYKNKPILFLNLLEEKLMLKLI